MLKRIIYLFHIKSCVEGCQDQYEDQETGLYYNRFRYYDSEAGTYISQDPIRLLGGPGLYSYVHDPCRIVDIFGLNENDPIHRIGGKSIENLRLKPAEMKLEPPGISVLKGGTPQDAAQQMRDAFPKSTGLHEASKTVGTSTTKKIQEAGFDVLPDPTKKFPNHHRITHPDGVNGFNDDNLKKLQSAFDDSPCP